VRLPLKHPGVAVMVGAGFCMLAFCTDMPVASLPGMVKYFGISVSQAQLTLSVYLVAYALSQLIYGPLSDRFGRRPTLYGGTLIFLAASIACALAPSIGTLIAARFFQAIGACAWAVVGRAIVRDIHGAEGTARMLGYIAAGGSLFIALGPVVGGVLEQSFGWRANFAFLAIFGVVLGVAAALFLKESNPHRDPRATGVAQMLGNYRVLVTDQRVWGYTVCNGFSFCCVMAFQSGASFVLMNLLGVSARDFGLLYGVSLLGYIASSFFLARWIVRFGAQRLLAGGTALGALAGTAMALLALGGVRSVAAIIVPYFTFMVAIGLSQPTAMAGAISPYARIAGTASALYGFVQLAFGATAGYVVGRLYDGTPLPLALAIGLSSWGAFLSYLLIIRPALARS
jgi:DHA1 family bicyclomycin/chloramphenicol resistance-like MFS transporter